MSRANPIMNSFVAGLLSRRMRARDDLDQYHSGMRQALNGTVLPHGGYMRRSGSIFVSKVKNRTGNNALIPFDVATNQQYVMEVGHNYIRYYANHGQVESSPGVPLETVTTYGNDEQQDLAWAQQVDVMYLVHANGHPHKLTRNSLTSFTWEKVVWKDGHAPMQPSNITTTTLAVNLGTLVATFSANPVIGGLLTANDVGRAIRWFDGVYEIATVTSPTTATLTVLHAATDPAATSGTATKGWAFGLFSNTDGPRSVLFHDGRLWYGGSRTAPNVFVGSRSDDYDNFDRGTSFGSTPTLGDDDFAIVKRVQGKNLQTIQWMASQGEYLVLGSSGGEFRTFSSISGGVLTPRTCIVRPATYRGSAAHSPVQIDTQLIFIQRNRREWYELRYDVVKDNFSSKNLTLLAEDVPDSDVNGVGGAQQIVYQASPDSVLWMVHGDGTIISQTYEPDQKVLGVSPHRIGTPASGVTVQSLAAIQNPDASAMELWFLATLKVSGVTEQYVCYIDEQYRPALSYEQATDAEKVRALDEAYFVDLGLKYNVPKLIEGFTKANPGVFTSTGHGFANNDRVKLRAPQGPVEMNLLSAIVSDVTANTFQLKDPDTLAYIDTTDWTDLGEVPNPSITNSNSPLVRKEITVVTGLGHLEGHVVQVLADGGVHPDRTVSGGAITLQRRASIVAVGLPFLYKGETQRFIGGARLGTDQGQPSIIDHVAMVLHNTMGGAFSVGNGIDHPVEPLNFREGSGNMNQSPPLFTGTMEVAVEDSWDGEATVYFENTQPLPMTVLAIMPRMQTNEG